jgi:hypothetical protein
VEGKVRAELARDFSSTQTCRAKSSTKKEELHKAMLTSNTTALSRFSFLSHQRLRGMMVGSSTPPFPFHTLL